MAIVQVRRFHQHPVQGWGSHLPLHGHRVHIARAILANATARLRPMPGDFAVFLGETRLLWSAVHTGPGVQLRFRDSLSRASSHVQRFVSEGAALAVTTSLADQYGWRLSRGLPVHVDLAFKWSGPRPDLLFPIASLQRIAAESRGRKVAKPAQTIRKAQTDRLSELEQWQASPNGSQWFMAWCWFTPGQTVVDFFDPGEPARLEPVIRQVANRSVSELWETAPELDRDLLGVPIRGAWLQADVFTPGEPGTLQAFVGVSAQDFPAGLRGTHRVGQAETEIAISRQMICVVSAGGGMDLADVAGILAGLQT